LICKPNAGNPVINAQGQAEYSMNAEEFSVFALQCKENGASLLGGCCGTDPQFLARVCKSVKY
jgi:5-methyltetrahydrofolate--homocysteine methyltransferase